MPNPDSVVKVRITSVPNHLWTIDTPSTFGPRVYSKNPNVPFHSKFDKHFINLIAKLEYQDIRRSKPPGLSVLVEVMAYPIADPYVAIDLTG